MSKGWVSHSEEASAPVSEVLTAAPSPFTSALRVNQAELTTRALLSGGTIGALLAITNVHMGLKTGMWETGSIVATLLTFSCMSTLVSRRSNAPTALETHLAQTLAVSVGALPSAAGLLGAIPALALLGVRPSGGWVALWGVGLGTLGVLIAYLLRRRLLEHERLPFPTGIATAELISTLNTPTPTHRGRARALWGTGLGTMLFTWLRDAGGVFPSVWLLPGQWRGIPLEKLLLGVGWNPMMLGIGMMLGVQGGLGLLLGTLVAWGGLAPWLVHEGRVNQVEFRALVAWLTWPGVGLMVGAAISSLVPLVSTLPKVLGDVWWLGRGAVGWEATAAQRVGRAVLPTALLALVAGGLALGMHPLQLLLSLLLVLPLCLVCAHSAGQTDIHPISPMGQLTQVAFGLVSPGQAALNVAAGSVVSGAAAPTGLSLCSLQAGRLLGATPSRQLLVQLLGLVLGAAVSLPAYSLLVTAHGLGTPELPVPTAHQFKTVAEFASKGLDGLPPRALLALGLGFGTGVLLSMATRGRLARLLPSATAMGVGFILPAHYAVTIALGAFLAAGVRRRWPTTSSHVQAVGTGAIMGESLVGLLVAALLALGLISSPG
ncbi:peptide transporter [Archangium minus]|uniref:Peptide transporter n=1 Tax=Archangium minus TaxID=83450 RepID=A0ABY9WYX8_9BACT|nr:peptide transporter [Archangium minus]